MSMIFDIYFLLDAISVTFQLPTDATDVARAGRAGRAGTKVGRLLKIVRMIRVFRVAKLYKETKKAINEQRKILKKNQNKAAHIKRGSKIESDAISQEDKKSDLSMPRQFHRAQTFQVFKRPSIFNKKPKINDSFNIPSTSKDKSFSRDNPDLANITELGIITNNDI